ncbi:GIY-YIG nuclease family protein [Aureitalea marina]|uniref:GIY-YIG domain-containing protein n=1 Tax=Aureitalea marina TaxID=930804 RepID=A0A2S7KNH9_9FLAO|nr:GIY-YIG nuclease family protein [Aureitalea marina]PQB04172.1 hypothetical protein BST85_04090 [Aureitalea marina]
MKTYYVYLLKCADNSYYSSITRHLSKRMQEHKAGKRNNTRNRRPVQLAQCLEFNSLSQAVSSELSLKNQFVSSSRQFE